MNFRSVKSLMLDLLRSEDLEKALNTVRLLPRQHAIKALLSCLLHIEEQVRWQAVTLIGRIVADLADEDMEAARVVMRRYMWSLNDESGGIGWGIPEAMAEALVCHERLAGEYAHILVSFMREDGFFLEYEPLQRGLLWGIARLATARPKLLLEKNAPRYIMPYLESADSAVRGMAAWALGNLHVQEAVARLRALEGDTQELRLYRGGAISSVSVGCLAREALGKIESGLTERG
jgi:hypothetical protein